MVGKKVLRKARIREVIHNYKSFLSIILIAVLCVALFTGLFANYKNFDIKVSSFYDTTNMADYFITTKAYDEKDLEGLRSSVSEIKEIEERVYLPLQYENKIFTLIAADEDSVISKPILKEGKPGVLVSPTFISAMGCAVGDTVTLSFSAELNLAIPSAMVLPNQTDYLSLNQVNLTFTIDGVMQHPEDVEKNSLYSGLIYMTKSSFQQAIAEALENTYLEPVVSMAKESLPLTLFINQMVITSDKDISTEINQYFMNKEASNLLSNLARDSFPTNSSIEMDVVQAKQLLFVFPMVFYLVGVLVIITSLKEFIHKERKNIGLFSALGFSKGEIIRHYSYIAIILVSIGSFLGLIIGPALIPNIMGRKYNVLYNLPDTKLPVFYIEYLYCFLIIVCVSILSAILVSYKEVNKTPAVILRNDEKKKIKNSRGKEPRRAFLPLKMSLRNMWLNPIRSCMVLIGVLGCSALLVCGFGIDDTLNYSVEKETKDLICYDAMISYSSSLELDSEEIEYIDRYEKLSVIALNAGKSYNTSVYIFEDNRQIFKPVIPKDGCMISKRLAEDLHLSIGDEIEYIYDNESYKLEVKCIEEMSFTSGIFMNAWDYPDYQSNGAYITLKDKTAVAEYKDRLLSMGATSVMTNEELSTQADNILSGIRGITLTVKVFAVLLALVVIYNLAQLNYKERIRDIATLKVLGFGKLEIAQTLLYELTVLTLVGSVLGMFLGKPLLVLLLKINQTSRFTYIYHISIPSYAIAIVLTLIISILINLVITKLSDRIEMVESLKSVE